MERWIGRSLAIWIHPVSAWHLPSRAARRLLVVGYGAAGYLVGLAVLYFFGTPLI